jgi:phage terminase large subunit GpA-like protein
MEGPFFALDHLDLSSGEAAFHERMDVELAAAATLPEAMLPSKWIYENVEFSQNDGISGHVKLTGFQAPIVDAIVDPEIETVVVKKGTQVGFSMMMALLTIFCLVWEAARVLFYQPTDDDAQEYFEDEIAPRKATVKAFARIQRIPGKGETKDKWSVSRFINGAILMMKGAASDDAARRVKARRIIMDEINALAWQGKANDTAQGNKVMLIKERGTWFWDTKFWMGSSPTNPDTIGEQAWLDSDQRLYNVPCPHCGHMQVLDWFIPKKNPGGFKYEKDANGKVVSCHYECISCRKAIPESKKSWMIEHGRYVATAIPRVPKTAGFHIPQWLSIAPRAGWVSIAQQWVDAQGDASLLQPWMNNKAAEAFADLTGETHDAGSLMSLRVAYPAEVPDDVVLLSAGVDRQDNKEGRKIGDHVDIASLEVSVIGWSRNEVPRTILHKVILGEIGDAQTEAELDAIILRTYAKRNGVALPVRATCIDIGSGKAGSGDAVKAYAAKRIKSNVFAIKGAAIKLGSTTSRSSVWPKKVSRRIKMGWQWFMIDTQAAKNVVGAKLKIRGAGAAMFPKSLEQDYFDGLSAESPVIDKKGRRYWKRTGKNTGEPWDCMVYAYAGVCALKASFPRMWSDLNVAARREGIAELPPHDPETGEVFDDSYAGPDRSVSAAATQDSPPTAKATAKDSSNARRAEPEAATKPAGAVVKRKNPAVRIVRSTRW